jgi:hypothetical protein
MTDETDEDREPHNDDVDVDDTRGTPPPDIYPEYYEICPLCDWAENVGERKSPRPVIAMVAMT